MLKRKDSQLMLERKVDAFEQEFVAATGRYEEVSMRVTTKRGAGPAETRTTDPSTMG